MGKSAISPSAMDQDPHQTVVSSGKGTGTGMGLLRAILFTGSPAISMHCTCAENQEHRPPPPPPPFSLERRAKGQCVNKGYGFKDLSLIPREGDASEFPCKTVNSPASLADNSALNQWPRVMAFWTSPENAVLSLCDPHLLLRKRENSSVEGTIIYGGLS